MVRSNNGVLASRGFAHKVRLRAKLARLTQECEHRLLPALVASLEDTDGIFRLSLRRVERLIGVRDQTFSRTAGAVLRDADTNGRLALESQ